MNFARVQAWILLAHCLVLVQQTTLVLVIALMAAMMVQVDVSRRAWWNIWKVMVFRYNRQIKGDEKTGVRSQLFLILAKLCSDPD